MNAKLLLRSLVLFLIVVAHADDQVSPSVIRWVGSAFKDGDAFTVTARVNADEVEIRWDGFAGQQFDFMDEAPKKRVQKDFVIKDLRTVNAFRTVAALPALCDAGKSGMLGQGVSIDAVIETPVGTVKRSMFYFHTTRDRPMAVGFAELPWRVKEMVDSKHESPVPEDSEFSRNVRDLGSALSSYDEAFQSLVAAFKNREELPSPQLKGFWEPIPLQRYLDTYQQTAKLEKSTLQKWLTVTESILRDGFSRENRSAFIGDTIGNPGIVVRLAPYHFGLETPLACLAMELGVPEAPVTAFSQEGENLLMHFITGKRVPGGMLIGDVCRLDFSADGKLRILSEGRRSYGGFDYGFLTEDETKTRLDYLNDRGIGSLLLGKQASDHTPVMVRIESIRIHPENEDRAKISFSQAGDDHVVEMTKREGHWNPGKTWDARDYYTIDGVYHNDTDFRPDGK